MSKHPSDTSEPRTDIGTARLTELESFWGRLRGVFTRPESPCMPGFRSRLSDFWWDYRPRLPRWDVSLTIYDPPHDLVSISFYDLNFIQRRRMVKYLRFTDAPSVVTSSRVD